MVSRPIAQERPAQRPDVRRRGRRTRRLVIVFVVLAALLVGADFGLAAFAEHEISLKARTQLGLTGNDPAVSIHGFPFTTQALAGDYSHITVYANGVHVNDKLRDVELNAELWDVTAPLSDLLAGNTKSIKIGRLEGQVTLKASDIARIAPLDKIENLRIDPSSEEYVLTGTDTKKKDATTTNAAGDQVTDDSKAGIRLSGEVRVAGQKVVIFCFAMIELDKGSIKITPHRLQYGNDKETTVVPDAVQQAFLPNFSATVNSGDLPFQVQATGVRVHPGSVTVKGEVKGVTFAGLPIKG